MKRLRRPKEGRIVAGVSQAFAHYFEVDIVFVRLIWIFLFLFGGIPGIVAYAASWFLIPEEN